MQTLYRAFGLVLMCLSAAAPVKAGDGSAPPYRYVDKDYDIPADTTFWEKQQAALAELPFDDTPDIETETTLDTTEDRKGVVLSGDARPIIDYINIDGRQGENEDELVAGVRARFRGVLGITDELAVGARAATLCFTGNNCDTELVLQGDSPTESGLDGGQVTLDELYILWSPADFATVAAGRLQTRFVLRSGVFAKSLDRNDSNNVNVTWTDGAQITFRERGGWRASAVWQRNYDEGTGSIRRGPLDFSTSRSKNTWFLGVENTEPWGLIVQRSLDISYLPDSLLVDNDSLGPRDDYWGLVGRVAAVWPQRRRGIRLRGGLEVGYAPNTASREGAALDTGVSGLAWDGVISLMDFVPGHSIGINYAQTGAGWYLSPQFRPNEELFEIRYLMQLTDWPLVEIRVRWREELEQQVQTRQKAEAVDGYLRLTWQFDDRVR